MTRVRNRPCQCLFLWLSTVAFLFLLPAVALSQPASKVDFDIPAQSLETALQQIARTQHVQILFSENDVKGVATAGVKGTLSILEAVQRLLEGTGLTAVANQNNAIAIKPAVSTSRGGQAENPTLRDERSNEAARSSGQEAQSMEQVTVTGTHIRGVSPASPLIVIDREEIDRSGYAVVGDLLRSLPQNFSGGSNPQVQIGSPTPENVSFSFGSSPNLRGLGPGSTLTLVNGHRLGQDGVYGAVDISLIPIDAVERVEIIADGASAAYGSDAVAGVVNFVLRKNYDGAQTNLSIGSATDGGGTEKRASQLFGGTWQGGDALLVYEHDDQQMVSAAKRSFTSTLPTPYSLLPESSRDSVFVSANQQISNGFAAFFDGLYTSRKSTFLASYPPAYGIPTARNPATVEQFAVNGGLKIDLMGNWKASVVMSAAGERNLLQDFFGDIQSMTSSSLFRGRTHGVEADADGPVGRVNGNTVRAALGAGTRNEALDETNTLTGASLLSANRNVDYIFGELNVPLFARAGLPGLEGLTVNASGRYDSYSDSGSKFVPKVGVVYGPSNNVSVHASWGESFRAPTLAALHSPLTIYELTIPDPRSPSGTSEVLYTNGGNSTLVPETAKTWNAGIDFDPVSALHLSLTYFRIDYSNRVLSLDTPYGALTDATLSPLVTNNPSASVQSALIAGAAGGFQDYSAVPYDPAGIAAIVDGRARNIARQKISGVDLGATYRARIGGGTVDLFLNGTYLNLVQQTTPASSSGNLAGQSFNPVRSRVRGGETWTTGPWSNTVTVNWLGAETNHYTIPFAHVSSWTTVDAQVSYAPRLAGLWSGLKISLSAQNLFDRKPPYITWDDSPGLHYDSLNASPLGRFIALQLRKEW